MEDTTYLLPAPSCAFASTDDDATRLARLLPLPERPPAPSEAATVPAPGAIIKGRFVLEARIGRGGMGTVYRARDLRKEETRDSEPRVAIKFLNPELRDQPDALIALQREAKKAQQLAHPNIVTVYDFDRDGGLVFLSMEYLEGEALDSLIARHAPRGLPAYNALPLIERIARGLAYAHQEGFVHADLKPGNVFVTGAGNVKILDFGIAQAVRRPHEPGAAEDPFNPYSLGAITPSYASAEMLREEVPAPADDVYALACLAYELLSGRHPFVDESGRKLPASEARERGLRPAPIRGLSRRHMRALRRGLAFERAQRFADAGQFIDAIKERPRLRRTQLALLTALALAAAVSVWQLAWRSDAAIDLDDLPPALSEAAEAVRLGDRVLDAGDLDQAQNLYAQAWDSAQRLRESQPRELYKLKVILGRRFARLTQALLAQLDAPGLDEFRLLQLQIALEFLRRDRPGEQAQAIAEGLARIQQRLEALRAAAAPDSVTDPNRPADDSP